MNSFSQEFTRDYIEKFTEADLFIHNDDNANALNILLDIYSSNFDNPNINFLVGATYMNLNNHEAAYPFLLRALPFVSPYYKQTYDDSTASVFTHFYLGIINQKKYRFNEAIFHFNVFRHYLNSEYADHARYGEFVEDLDRWVQTCNNAQKHISTRKEIIIENVLAPVNSGFPEYSPVVSMDMKTMYFTARRPENIGGLKDRDDKYFEDLYISTYSDSSGKWENVQNMGSTVNTKGHEATISLSYDGTQLFIYRDDKGIGNIYVSKLVNNEWSKAEKLSINSSSWEPHASLSPDNKTLYFTSNRPGGFGGTDIYKSELLPDGQWSRPENIGATINTRYNDDSPFILSDGKTLFFASKGHDSMGGFDLFTSMLNDDETWTIPENLGFPINTTEDDVFYYPTSDPKLFYYSSAKEGGYGDMDIYSVRILDERDIIAVLKGNVFDELFFRPLKATFLLYEREPVQNSTQQTLGDSTHFTLTTNINGNGTVEKNPDQSTYDAGTIVSLTANSVNGWSFSGWGGDLSGNEAAMNITMDANKTVSATFTQQPTQYTLTTNVVGSGIVTRIPDQATYSEGSIVTITANQAVGWSFDNWTGDITNNNKSQNIVMNANKTVNATFIQQTVDTVISDSAGMQIETLTDAEKEQQRLLISEQRREQLSSRFGEYVKTFYTYHRTGEFYTNLQVGKVYDIAVIAEGYDTLFDVIDISSFNANQVITRMYLLRVEGTALAELQLEELEVEIDTVPKIIYFEDITEVKIGDKIVLKNILYDFDKATLRPESIDELNKLIEFLQQRPTLRIEISSHTDNRGSARYNKKLSEQRAKSCVDYLSANGIDISRLEFAGYGFDDPIATNDTDEGRQMNRRTEFIVIGL
ncbi:MAG: OmpA family protein [Bacteroidales bacterium]|nr:OmpA family protein [Bacteroidales bacterium]